MNERDAICFFLIEGIQGFSYNEKRGSLFNQETVTGGRWSSFNYCEASKKIRTCKHAQALMLQLF